MVEPVTHRQMLDNACFCTHPGLSPDGQRTVVSVTDATTGNADIRIYEEDGTRLPLTSDPAPEGHPSWNADGSRVIFTSFRMGFRDIYWKASDGSGSTEPLLRSDRDKYVHSVSDHGIVFNRQGAKFKRYRVNATKRTRAKITTPITAATLRALGGRAPCMVVMRRA